jgi:guanylate cyclase
MSDIYAFGILVYEAYSRSSPYAGEETQEVLRLVADRKVNKRPPVPIRCPPEVEAIMHVCLQGEPEKRPTADELDAKLASTSQCGSKTQSLLWQLFPRHVAAALREGRKVEPETHQNITVLLSEIVGFSSLETALPPTKLSNLLDRLYTKFDSLCDLHNVFKIETSEETFMCVTNLAEEQNDHVRIMAAFATDALKAAACTLIDDQDPSKGYVKIRIGFHTGPVVSHVVGSKTPRYSIIGETVTMASKLKEMCTPQRVQCSDLSADLLKKQNPEAELFLRGAISINSEKEAVAYWVGEPILPGSEAISICPKNGTSGEGLKDMDSLIEWNVDVLQRLIKEIVAARDASSAEPEDFSQLRSGQGTVFDEVIEVVPLPAFDKDTVRRMKEHKGVDLDPTVLSQLRDFVTAISQMYHQNVPFHNFEVS